MYNCKKKIRFALTIVCLVLVLCIVVPFLASNMYVHSLFTSAKPVESYDGSFAFLHLLTSKEHVRTVNIYNASHAFSKQRIRTFNHSYNKYDMKEIMWGSQSNDLFFWTDEGVYAYKYDEKTKQWVGPLYFYITGTEELRLQGIDDVYYFEPMGKMVGSDFLPIPAEFCQIPRQTVPARLVNEIERVLSKYKEGAFE